MLYNLYVLINRGRDFKALGIGMSCIEIAEESETAFESFVRVEMEEFYLPRAQTIVGLSSNMLVVPVNFSAFYLFI